LEADINKENSSPAGRTCPRLLSLTLALLLTAIAARSAFAQDLKTVSASLANRVAASGRKTVAVIDFTDLQGNVTELGRFLAEELSVDLVNDAKGFEVIERTQLKTILQEHKLAATGVIDPQTARKLGQIAGVDALVTGTITPLGDSVRLSAKVLDTTTAKMIGAYTVDIPKTKAIEELLAKGIGDSPPSSGPEPPGIRQAAKAVSVEENDLLFVPKVCWRSGSVLSCAGSITNKAGERRFVQLEDSQVVDDLGNQYELRTFGFGNANSPRRQQVLEPDLPFNFSLSIDGANPAASRANIILSYYYEGYGGRGAGRTKVALRNVPIQQK